MAPPGQGTPWDPLLAAQKASGRAITNCLTNLDKLGKELITADVVKHRLQLLENYWLNFFEKHQQLFEHYEEIKEEDYFMNDYFSEIEEKYLSHKVEISSRLSALIGALQGALGNTGADPPGTTYRVTTTDHSLPKLSLPKFSGQQDEWESFKEIFSSMVKDSPTLTPVLKLQHLVSCLEGDARRRVENMTIIGSNFEVAWGALETRYDNKRLRLTVQLNKLLGMPPASGKSVVEITRLLDTTNQCIRSLRSLKRPVDTWDDWFVQLVVFNLDSETREDWEKSLEGVSTFPTYAGLTKFLENRTKALDTAHCGDSQVQQRAKGKATNGRSTRQASVNVKTVSAHLANSSATTRSSNKTARCAICKGEHYSGYCPTLLQQSQAKRMELVNNMRLCRNCLRSGHVSTSCPSKSRCRHCQQEHHSVLHPDTHNEAKPVPPQGEFLTPGPKPGLAKVGSNQLNCHFTFLGLTTLLGTARIVLQSNEGISMEFRALIDPCSEASFISEKVAQALGLARTPCHTTVTGVGGEISATASTSTNLALKSRLDTSLSLVFSAVILPRLSALLPRQPVYVRGLDHLRGLEMADPDFANPGTVDCILGGELYPTLILEGLRKGTATQPVAQRTRLGWILTGPSIDGLTTAQPTRRCFFTTTSTADQLRRFWEIEEVAEVNPLTPEEEECERHFQLTHSREQNGRYVVRLPFRSTPSTTGSRHAALCRLLSGERRLSRDAEHRLAYSTFMQEYEEMGHMERVPAPTDDDNCYLPHHAVIGRKLRVVFGEILNPFLHSGPKLQKAITTILTRWRRHRFVFTADIVKMFRQIRVHKDDCTWQRILWRESPEQPVQDFQLLTVTYGTACAPYLSLRVLQQLAKDEKTSFPLGAHILENDVYVDDFLTGADTIELALNARQQLQQILATAGMQLSKWAANHSTLLQDVEGSTSSTDLCFDSDDIVSTLGLRWSPREDTFQYKLRQLRQATMITKRTILGEVAQLYDPLGLLAPVTVRAKILLQMLWISGQNWDDPVDSNLQQQWEEFRAQLPTLEQLRIPRWFGTTSSQYQLHGFADSSEKAYAAAVYMVELRDGEVRSTLISAKSKVAPIKTVSLPRLELCGALLLCRLLKQVQEDLGNLDAPVYCWSDSQVVLAWLKGRPNSWKTFVANRVSEILTTLPSATWRHVRSALNPADHATRGLTPNQLLEEALWWKGPQVLFQDDSGDDQQPNFETVLERRAEMASFHTTANADQEPIETLLARFSNFKRMTRVLAYIFRWQRNTKLPAANRTASLLSADELEDAQRRLIVEVQRCHFTKDLAQLRQGKAVHQSSNLRRLLPFLDDQGLLRVGGRLQQAYLSNREKHPVLIPRDSRLADLLIDNAHYATLHGGPQLMQSHLLRSYWIPQSRNKIRLACRQCVRCLRFQGRPFEQQMAPLPATRVTPGRPFNITGLDYAGPFAVRTSKGRGQRASKGYVAIFTCFVTRAVHIEIVSDYTSKTFLLAFRRFVSRRGLCSQVYSDNGTTFQGADSELRRLFQEASDFSKDVAEAVQADGVLWNFIPPRAPHFGGLWEAAVKSFKHHLKRVVGEAKLTYEEFSTLAACIEACLNSRPLSPISSDPTDLVALTPGHFLVGTALKAPPEPPSKISSVTGLQRWQWVSQMQQHFWRRWRKEVLHQMQQRSKWLQPNPGPAEGDLVILTDDLLPPLKWPLARIESLHPGPDGLARVATLRTATTTLRRPLAKVICLPPNQQASSHYTALGTLCL